MPNNCDEIERLTKIIMEMGDKIVNPPLLIVEEGSDCLTTPLARAYEEVARNYKHVGFGFYRKVVKDDQ